MTAFTGLLPSNAVLQFSSPTNDLSCPTQTGSGKTYTMMGTEEDPGVNRRAVRELLRVCAERVTVDYTIKVAWPNQPCSIVDMRTEREREREREREIKRSQRERERERARSERERERERKKGHTHVIDFLVSRGCVRALVLTRSILLSSAFLRLQVSLLEIYNEKFVDLLTNVPVLEQQCDLRMDPKTMRA